MTRTRRSQNPGPRQLWQGLHRQLRVAIEQRPTALAAIALSVRAGTRYDGPWPGLAHFTEHMLFQGTRQHSPEELHRLAGKLGAEHNAVTRYETITIMMECFARDVERAIALLAEQYYHAVVSADRFCIERRVVLDEIRNLSTDPVAELEEAALCRFFTGGLAHPLGGTPRSIRKLTPDHVRRFRQRHFVHGTTSLAVTGGVDIELALRLIERSFDGQARPAPPVPEVRPGKAGLLRRRQCGGMGYVLQLIEAPPAAEEFLATVVALEILGDAPDTRLFREIRGKLGLGYTVTTDSSRGPDWAVLLLGASCPRAQAGRRHNVIESVSTQAATNGFDPDEFVRARQKMRFAYALLEESLLDRAIALAEDPLLEFPLPEQAQELLSNLSCESVSAAWRKAWNGRRLVAVLE